MLERIRWLIFDIVDERYYFVRGVDNMDGHDAY